MISRLRRRAMTVRTIVAAYAYQFANQLPQLIVLPIMAKMLAPSALILAAKYFASINLINIVTDWGYSTIGSQRLFRHVDDRTRLAEIFGSGELLRLILWGAAIVLCLLFAASDIGIGSELWHLMAVVLLGTLSWIILPNWLIIGTRSYDDVLPIVLLMRVTSIALLFGLVVTTGDVVFALAAYFGAQCLFSLVVRQAARRRAGIATMESWRAAHLAADLRSGMLIMCGTACSFGFLNTGVFFVDRFGSKASAAAFVIADRLLASVRAAYAPLIQHVFVGLAHGPERERGMTGTFVSIVVGGTFLVWITGRVLLQAVFHDALAQHYFNILIIGFLFLGFSHYYVTLRTLGRGLVRWWLGILALALLVYLLALGGLAFVVHIEAATATSCAIIMAEITVFVLGISLRRSKR